MTITFQILGEINKFIKPDLEAFEKVELTDSIVETLLSKCKVIMEFAENKNMTKEQYDAYYAEVFQVPLSFSSGPGKVSLFYDLLLQLSKLKKRIKW